MDSSIQEKWLVLLKTGEKQSKNEVTASSRGEMLSADMN